MEDKQFLSIFAFKTARWYSVELDIKVYFKKRGSGGTPNNVKITAKFC